MVKKHPWPPQWPRPTGASTRKRFSGPQGSPGKSWEMPSEWYDVGSLTNHIRIMYKSVINQNLAIVEWSKVDQNVMIRMSSEWWFGTAPPFFDMIRMSTKTLRRKVISKWWTRRFRAIALMSMPWVWGRCVLCTALPSATSPRKPPYWEPWWISEFNSCLLGTDMRCLMWYPESHPFYFTSNLDFESENLLTVLSWKMEFQWNGFKKEICLVWAFQPKLLSWTEAVAWICPKN